MVYEAIDLKSGYKVAIKRLHSKLYERDDIKEKFREEANHYLYLQHKNIAGVKDFVINKTGYHIVMEFIEGYTLSDYIHKYVGLVPEEKAIEILLQVLAAINYCHKRDILHLDIKPSNIMLADSHLVKIIDFGISANLSDNKLDDYSITGSPMYMSPEQINKKKIDERTDIYAMGLVLYEMVTRKYPYPRKIKRDVLFEIICEQMPIKPRQIYPVITPQLQQIIFRAIAKDPDERYQSCNEFISDIKSISS